ncbi:MAG TPA: TetR/AcrR family transcriptional regulator [Mycobacterium sp.]|nr:TetR/AcrR family transcriptional regulator [Mycobacterium sp.]
MSEIRDQMIEGGLQILERDGVSGLSARKLAAETGTSTMAVYTHFGGMTGLLEAIALAVFARFTRALTDVEQTDDPVADFIVMGARYREFALADRQRYQLMFGTSADSLNRFHTDLTVTGSPAAGHEFGTSFGALLTAVRRMIAAGRIRDEGESVIAGRLWAVSHGEVLLEMGGFFGYEDRGLTEILAPLILDVLVGMGDERRRVDESFAAAVERIMSGSHQGSSAADSTPDDAPRRPSRP